MKGTGLVIVLTAALAATAALALHFHATQLKLQDELVHAQVCVLPTPVAAPELKPPPVVEVPTPTLSVQADTNLQRRVLELEAALRAKDDVIASLRQTPTNDVRPRDRQDWLEQLKKDDPKRYDEIIKDRDESRRKVREAYARKAEHFLEHDTSAMPDAEREQYNMMLKLLDDTWKISDQLRTENLPQDQRRELMGTMHDTMDQLAPLLETERNREFYNLALDLGYKETEAADFVTYVTNILDATSMRSVFPRGRGGPGGRDGSTNQGNSARTR